MRSLVLIAASIASAPTAQTALAQAPLFFESFDGDFDNVWFGDPFLPIVPGDPPFINFLGFPDGEIIPYAGEQAFRLTNQLWAIEYKAFAADYVINDPVGIIIEARVQFPSAYSAENGGFALRVIQPDGNSFYGSLVKTGAVVQECKIIYGDEAPGGFQNAAPFLDDTWYRFRIDNSRPYVIRVQLLDDNGFPIGQSNTSQFSLQALQPNGDDDLYIAIAQHGVGAMPGDTCDVVIDYVQIKPGCPADFLVPWGVLDQSDIDFFIQFYLQQDDAVDIAPPFGIFDQSDIDVFIASYLAGCP